MIRFLQYQLKFKGITMESTRKPIKKSLSNVPVEEAHGGSGSRQVIFSKLDDISRQFDAWTKGYLPVGSCYDWHHHDGIDEFFIVLQGKGYIEYQDSTKFQYESGDIFYNPANLPHKIQNEDDIENTFFFIRLKA